MKSLDNHLSLPGWITTNVSNIQTIKQKQEKKQSRLVLKLGNRKKNPDQDDAINSEEVAVDLMLGTVDSSWNLCSRERRTEVPGAGELVRLPPRL